MSKTRPLSPPFAPGYDQERPKVQVRIYGRSPVMVLQFPCEPRRCSAIFRNVRLARAGIRAREGPDGILAHAYARDISGDGHGRSCHIRFVRVWRRLDRDITIVANTIQDAQEAQKRFLVLAAHLDIEVRDLTAVSPQIKAVGIEYDLQQHRWRLLDAWRSKVLESGLPPKADFDAQRLLLEAGRVAWAAYALQVPFLPFSDGLREAGRLANNLITGTNTVEDPVDLSEKAFRSLRMGRALINRNPWRTIAPSPSMTVVTDASTYGFGLMYEENGKCVERSVPNAMHSDADDEHITVREAVALRLAVCRPQHMNRSVTCVTDNSALFWILQRGRMPRGTSLRHEVVKLFRWCFKFEVTLFPMWLCTASMAQFGADEASRSSLGYTKYVMKSRLRDCVKCAAADTAVLAAGCHMPARIGRYALPQDLASQMFDSLGPKPA